MGKYNAVSTFGLMIGSIFSGYVFDIYSFELCLAMAAIFYLMAYMVIYRFVKMPTAVI